MKRTYLKTIFRSIAVCTVFCSFFIRDAAGEEKGFRLKPDLAKNISWIKESLFDVPCYETAAGFSKEATSEIKPIYYDGVKTKDAPTQVFAWLGVPHRQGSDVPGIVLVHGGNGSAVYDWVRRWVDRGYAAIAMDLNGGVPAEDSSGNIVSKKCKNGVPGTWDGFENSDRSLEEQWMYHAINAVIRANSILESQPGVDAGNIGIIGFSWGGVVALDTIGVDHRFKFAVSIYGCGYLGEGSFVQKTKFCEMPEDAVVKWLSVWDPGKYIKHARIPVLFCNNVDDEYFPFTSWRKTWQSLKGAKILCTRVETPHSQNYPDSMPEVFVFADQYAKGAPQLLKINRWGVNRFNYAWVLYENGTPLTRAVLNYTNDEGPLGTRKWEQKEAVIKRKYVTTLLPNELNAYFYEFYDDRGCVMSSQMQVVR